MLTLNASKDLQVLTPTQGRNHLGLNTTFTGIQTLLGANYSYNAVNYTFTGATYTIQGISHDTIEGAIVALSGAADNAGIRWKQSDNLVARSKFSPERPSDWSASASVVESDHENEAYVLSNDGSSYIDFVHSFDCKPGDVFDIQVDIKGLSGGDAGAVRPYPNIQWWNKNNQVVGYSSNSSVSIPSDDVWYYGYTISNRVAPEGAVRGRVGITVPSGHAGAQFTNAIVTRRSAGLKSYPGVVPANTVIGSLAGGEPGAMTQAEARDALGVTPLHQTDSTNSSGFWGKGHTHAPLQTFVRLNKKTDIAQNTYAFDRVWFGLRANWGHTPPRETSTINRAFEMTISPPSGVAFAQYRPMKLVITSTNPPRMFLQQAESGTVWRQPHEVWHSGNLTSAKVMPTYSSHSTASIDMQTGGVYENVSGAGGIEFVINTGTAMPINTPGTQITLINRTGNISTLKFSTTGSIYAKGSTGWVSSLTIRGFEAKSFVRGGNAWYEL